jgi:hypothetical protein
MVEMKSWDIMIRSKKISQKGEFFFDVLEPLDAL